MQLYLKKVCYGKLVDHSQPGTFRDDYMNKVGMIMVFQVDAGQIVKFFPYTKPGTSQSVLTTSLGLEEDLTVQTAHTIYIFEECQVEENVASDFFMMLLSLCRARYRVIYKKGEG